MKALYFKFFDLFIHLFIKNIINFLIGELGNRYKIFHAEVYSLFNLPNCIFLNH